MPTPEQKQALVERYVSKQLSPEQTAAFERTLPNDPELNQFYQSKLPSNAPQTDNAPLPGMIPKEGRSSGGAGRMALEVVEALPEQYAAAPALGAEAVAKVMTPDLSSTQPFSLHSAARALAAKLTGNEKLTEGYPEGFPLTGALVEAGRKFRSEVTEALPGPLAHSAYTPQTQEEELFGLFGSVALAGAAGGAARATLARQARTSAPLLRQIIAGRAIARTEAGGKLAMTDGELDVMRRTLQFASLDPKTVFITESAIGLAAGGGIALGRWAGVPDNLQGFANALGVPIGEEEAAIAADLITGMTAAGAGVYGVRAFTGLAKGLSRLRHRMTPEEANASLGDFIMTQTGATRADPMGAVDPAIKHSRELEPKFWKRLEDNSTLARRMGLLPPEGGAPTPGQPAASIARLATDEQGNADVGLSALEIGLTRSDPTVRTDKLNPAAAKAKAELARLIELPPEFVGEGSFGDLQQLGAEERSRRFAAEMEEARTEAIQLREAYKAAVESDVARFERAQRESMDRAFAELGTQLEQLSGDLQFLGQGVAEDTPAGRANSLAGRAERFGQTAVELIKAQYDNFRGEQNLAHAVVTGLPTAQVELFPAVQLKAAIQTIGKVMGEYTAAYSDQRHPILDRIQSTFNKKRAALMAQDGYTLSKFAEQVPDPLMRQQLLAQYDSQVKFSLADVIAVRQDLGELYRSLPIDSKGLRRGVMEARGVVDTVLQTIEGDKQFAQDLPDLYEALGSMLDMDRAAGDRWMRGIGKLMRDKGRTGERKVAIEKLADSFIENKAKPATAVEQFLRTVSARGGRSLGPWTAEDVSPLAPDQIMGAIAGTDTLGGSSVINRAGGYDPNYEYGSIVTSPQVLEDLYSVFTAKLANAIMRPDGMGGYRPDAKAGQRWLDAHEGVFHGIANALDAASPRSTFRPNPPTQKPNPLPDKARTLAQMIAEAKGKTARAVAGRETVLPPLPEEPVPPTLDLPPAPPEPDWQSFRPEELDAREAGQRDMMEGIRNAPAQRESTVTPDRLEAVTEAGKALRRMGHAPDIEEVFMVLEEHFPQQGGADVQLPKRLDELYDVYAQEQSSTAFTAFLDAFNTYEAGLSKRVKAGSKTPASVASPQQAGTAATEAKVRTQGLHYEDVYSAYKRLASNYRSVNARNAQEMDTRLRQYTQVLMQGDSLSPAELSTATKTLWDAFEKAKASGTEADLYAFQKLVSKTTEATERPVHRAMLDLANAEPDPFRSAIFTMRRPPRDTLHLIEAYDVMKETLADGKHHPVEGETSFGPIRDQDAREMVAAFKTAGLDVTWNERNKTLVLRKPYRGAAQAAPSGAAAVDAGLTPHEIARHKTANGDPSKLRQAEGGFAFVGGEWRKVTQADVDRAKAFAAAGGRAAEPLAKLKASGAKPNSYVDSQRIFGSDSPIANTYEAVQAEINRLAQQARSDAARLERQYQRAQAAPVAPPVVPAAPKTARGKAKVSAEEKAARKTYEAAKAAHTEEVAARKKEYAKAKRKYDRAKKAFDAVAAERAKETKKLARYKASRKDREKHEVAAGWWGAMSEWNDKANNNAPTPPSSAETDRLIAARDALLNLRSDMQHFLDNRVSEVTVKEADLKTFGAEIEKRVREYREQRLQEAADTYGTRTSLAPRDLEKTATEKLEKGYDLSMLGQVIGRDPVGYWREKVFSSSRSIENIRELRNQLDTIYGRGKGQIPEGVAAGTIKSFWDAGMNALRESGELHPDTRHIFYDPEATWKFIDKYSAELQEMYKGADPVMMQYIGKVREVAFLADRMQKEHPLVAQELVKQLDHEVANVMTIFSRGYNIARGWLSIPYAAGEQIAKTAHTAAQRHNGEMLRMVAERALFDATFARKLLDEALARQKPTPYRRTFMDWVRILPGLAVEKKRRRGGYDPEMNSGPLVP